MQFDHVRGVKSFGIGGRVTSRVETLAAEIAKCDVVCANCHAERTHGRGYSSGRPRFDESDEDAALTLWPMR